VELWQKVKGEFIDIIEWKDDSTDTMVWRFPRYHDEIKQGAQLTVRPSQVAVFVNEGRLADVFQPGMHQLATRNLPLLSTILGWKYGFDSPFRVEVYFVNTKNFTDLKWGTRNPVILRDAEFGPVRLRAFGTYVVRVQDAAAFVKQIAGTNAHFTIDEVSDQLRNLIVSRFADFIAEARVPVLDLAANYDQLSAHLAAKIAPEFLEYGLEVTKLLIENISLPPEVEQALDKRTSMGIVGNLDKYLKYQAGTAMEQAAQNPGGEASGGIGMGMGFAMANQMAQSLRADGAGGPPPLAAAGEQYYVAQNGREAGPLDRAALAAMVSQGAVQRDTLVWKKGMDNWQPASQVADVAALFDALPPPLHA
jgi:membrane protease subunit (stomatin/prohibitin family)